MKLYMFQYCEDKALHELQVNAANVWDAFDVFRAHKPEAVIAEAWVVSRSPQQNYIDKSTGLAG